MDMIVNQSPTIMPGPLREAITAVFPGEIAMKSLFPPVGIRARYLQHPTGLELRQMGGREDVVHDILGLPARGKGQKHGNEKGASVS